MMDFTDVAKARFVANWFVGRDAWELYPDSLRVKKTFMGLKLQDKVISLARIHTHSSSQRRLKMESFAFLAMLLGGLSTWLISVYWPAAKPLHFTIEAWLELIWAPTILFLSLFLTPRCWITIEADVPAKIDHQRWEESRARRFCNLVLAEARVYQQTTSWWNTSEYKTTRRES